MAAGKPSNDQAKSSNKAVGSAFGAGGAAWNTGIWGNSIGSMKNGAQETGRAQSARARSIHLGYDPERLMSDCTDVSLVGGHRSENTTITGSRSLLPLSESDNSTTRHTPWESTDETSPGLSTACTSRSRASPERRQKSNRYDSHGFADTNNPDSSVFSVAPGMPSISSRPSQQKFLDPTTRDFVVSEALGSSSLNPFPQPNCEDDAPYGSRKGGFGAAELGLTFPSRSRPSGSQNISGYTSSVGSRAGSLPPSRNDADPSARVRGDAQNLQYTRYGAITTTQRGQPSAHAAPFMMHTGPSGQRIGEQPSPTQLDSLSGQFDRFSLASQQRRPSYTSLEPSPNNSSTGQFSNALAHASASDAHDGWALEANGYLGPQDRFSSASISSSGLLQNQYRGTFGGPFSHSPSDSDVRLSHQSSFYSIGGTPPNFTQQNTLARAHHHGASTAQAVILEKRLQGLQQQQQQQQQHQHQGYSMPQQNPPQFRNQTPYPYDVNTHQALRMHALNSYYPMAPAPHLLTGSHVPRGPARDHDLAGHLRSPLLDEFRNNGKVNKRYELKVIPCKHYPNDLGANDTSRTSTTTLWNLAVINTVLDLSSRSSSRLIATRRNKCSRSFIRTLAS